MGKPWVSFAALSPEAIALKGPEPGAGAVLLQPSLGMGQVLPGWLDPVLKGLLCAEYFVLGK